jgi:hypothetical protein
MDFHAGIWTIRVPDSGINLKVAEIDPLPTGHFILEARI